MWFSLVAAPSLVPAMLLGAGAAVWFNLTAEYTGEGSPLRHTEYRFKCQFDNGNAFSKGLLKNLKSFLQIEVCFTDIAPTRSDAVDTNERK